MKIEAMLWIIVLMLVALSLLFPKTRPLSFSAIGVAIIAIVALVVVSRRGELPIQAAATSTAVVQQPIDFEKYLVEKLDRTDPDAKNRIRLEEIRFDQVRADAGAERGSIGSVVARLYNDSATYTLTDYGYSLVVQDCIQSACTTIFDQHGMAAVAVPPNQARDVKIAIRDESTGSVPPIKILGAAKILLTPAATRAALAGMALTQSDRRGIIPK